MSFEDVGIGSEDEDEIHRWNDAVAAVAETAVPRDDCPPPERIWDASRGEVPPEELRELVDHTATCAVCAEAWQLAEELTREEVEAETVPASAGEDEGEGGFWRNWMQVAAMVVVLAGAAFLVRDPAQQLVERGAADPAVTTLMPQSAQPRGDLILRWTPLPADGGPRVTYDVEVTWETAQAKTPILRAEGLTRAELAVPPAQLEVLSEGEHTLLWEVIARRGTEEVARGTFTVRVR